LLSKEPVFVPLASEKRASSLINKNCREATVFVPLAKGGQGRVPIEIQIAVK
jgi:hypothetical protein